MVDFTWMVELLGKRESGFVEMVPAEKCIPAKASLALYKTLHGWGSISSVKLTEKHSKPSHHATQETSTGLNILEPLGG